VYSQKRKRREPVILQDFALNTSTGVVCEVDDLSTSVNIYWRRTVYFRIIDEVISNLNKRFSNESLELAISIDNCYTLNINKSLTFINRYKVCWCNNNVIF
jgi:hypothetical protein